MVDLRRILETREPKTLPVTGPLSVWELIFWYAVTDLEALAVHAVWTRAILRKSNTEIGLLGKQVIERKLCETAGAGDG